MKRDHRESYGGTGTNAKAESSSMAAAAAGDSVGKSKFWEEEQDAGDMDELLAVLGYKIRSSEVADVAQKLEQLEMVMGAAQEDGVSHLSCDTVHYNPTDLSGWVQSMLSELNNPLNTTTGVDASVSAVLQNQHEELHGSASSTVDFSNPSQTHQSNTFLDDSECDLRAIPGVAAYSQPHQSESENRGKRIKTSLGSSPNSNPSNRKVTSSPLLPTPTPTPTPALLPSSSSRPMLVMDSQETGVRLVHSLLACAEAVQQNNLETAEALVRHIGYLASSSQVGAMKKVATYFAEGLARRIYKIYPQDCLDPSYTETLEMHFYETCPYLKFAHFTANQAILESLATASRVHVIDFGIKQGMQWPALMQALALRQERPPVFRLTGIGPPQPNNADYLQQVGLKLAQLADAIGVKFEFRGLVVNSLSDLELKMLDLQPPEVVVVNSVFELHSLLARPSGIEKVLTTIKAMRPKILTIVEQEANHNGPVFLDRFTESLHYYSSLFDSLEESGLSPSSQDVLMSELYLGRQICNVVACEGAERVERHESLTEWRHRLESSGFNLVHLGSNGFKQASMLLALFGGGDGYNVEEHDGCLMLGWHTRPLIATSAWELRGSEWSELN